MVLQAANSQSPEHRASLSALCETYWPPLYLFLRRNGASPEDAQDHTQAFFAQLLERRGLRHADQDRGRFRSFLLSCLKHFVSNQRAAAKAQKRGGGISVLPFDFASAEGAYTMEPADEMTPEKLFDRRWALTLLDRATTRLRYDMTREGKRETFDRLIPLLTKDGSYPDAAVALGISEGAARVAVHRMKHRFRKALREEVAQTVAGPTKIDEEIKHLLAAVAT